MQSGIHSKKRIQELLRKGNVFRGGGLKINWLLSGGDGVHIAVSLSRKQGNAVVRNRFKRRIREAFRLRIAMSVDMLVRAEKVAMSFSDMSREAGILNERVYGTINTEAVS